MPNPSPRDPFIDAIAEHISEAAKCLIMFFVMPPLLTIAGMALIEWMR